MKHSLHALFAPPDGFAFFRGMGCTYSVNERTWRAVRQILCGRDVGRHTAFEEGRSFRLYFQQGEYSGAPQNGLAPVSPARGCLHAKVYALEYRSLDGGAARFRIIAASANLTNEDELNLFASFDSCGAGSGPIGGQTAELLRRVLREAGERSVWEEAPGFLDRLAQAGFDGDAQLLLPASARFREVFEQDLQRAQRLVVVSPFLSEGVLQRLSRRAGPVSVVSRQAEMDRLGSDAGCRFYRMGDGEEDGRSLPDALHAKLYVIDTDGGQVLYLGSANATHSAFTQNIEALVRIEAALDVQALLEQFVPYVRGDGAAAENPGAEAFEALCRELVRSFYVAGQEGAYYYCAAQQEGITVWLNGAPGQKDPASSSWRWEKTRTETHMVELTVFDQDRHRKQISLFVRGEPVPCDRERVCMDCLASCFGGGRRPAEERETGRGGETGLPSQTRGGRTATYSELILSIRDGDTARRVLQVVNSCLEDREADETARAYWRAVETGIRRAFFEEG